MSRRLFSSYPFVPPTTKHNGILNWECTDGNVVHRDTREDSVWITRSGDVIATLPLDRALDMGESMCSKSEKGSQEYVFGQSLSSAATTPTKDSESS